MFDIDLGRSIKSKLLLFRVVLDWDDGTDTSLSYINKTERAFSNDFYKDSFDFDFSILLLFDLYNLLYFNNLVFLELYILIISLSMFIIFLRF
jgi:hypothetical protein